MTFHVRRGSIMRFTLRGRGSIWSSEVSEAAGAR